MTVTASAEKLTLNTVINRHIAIYSLQRILPQKMPFLARQKVQISSKILSVFRHPKMRLFQQCITATAVNLFYEVLPKQFEAFSVYFSHEKQVTAEYWVS